MLASLPTRLVGRKRCLPAPVLPSRADSLAWKPQISDLHLNGDYRGQRRPSPVESQPSMLCKLHVRKRHVKTCSGERWLLWAKELISNTPSERYPNSVPGMSLASRLLRHLRMMLPSRAGLSGVAVILSCMQPVPQSTDCPVFSWR